MSETAPPGQMVQVELKPVGCRVAVTRGTTVLDATRAAGVELVAACGGEGVCDTCKVERLAGTLSPLTTTEKDELYAEDIDAGFRLACQAVLLSDAHIALPPESLATAQRLQLEGHQVAIAVDPLIVPIDVDLAPPSLDDLRPDATRLTEALVAQGRPSPVISASVLSDSTNRLRENAWRARLALAEHEGGEELIAVMPPGARLLGLALDLGTTKLAGYLVDLVSGVVLAQAGAVNPQISYGEDVVSRIAYANRHADHLRVLQARLVEAVNALVETLCAEAEVSRDQIVNVVAVGNTVLHHLFLGLPVYPLGEAPYVPVTSNPLRVRADAIGLSVAPGAYVDLPSNIAGYVGGDHVAMLLAADIWKTPQTVVALDIGTNTELTLATGGRLLTCACASGPAFEGAHIRDGMRAVPGAIEHVHFSDGVFHVHTVESAPPIGICGSGILDAVAALRAAACLTESGALQEGDSRIHRRDEGLAFILAPAATSGHGRDIVVTRSDVHEIQLAKGAIRAGIELLLREADLPASAVDVFVVAGAFGTYLRPESAIQIGMFPDLPVERFRQVGNAAGMGAIQMLRSVEQRRIARDIAQRIEYIELSNHPYFTETFMDALFL